MQISAPIYALGHFKDVEASVEQQGEGGDPGVSGDGTAAGSFH